MKLLSTISQQLFQKKVTNAPLVTFRILFGLMMLAAIIRFWINGWIKSQYIDPTFYFPFIDGISPLEGQGMYVVFALMALTALMIAVGYFYRFATTGFFLLFTYVELLDKTNYLNHYYFISLVSFIMIWLPAHKRFSLDVWRKAVQPARSVPVIYQNAIKAQLCTVYFFAGIAKINSDWLFNAQPLKMWLAALTHKPVFGTLFKYKITAYIFSWFGMLFDVTVPFLLNIRKTLPYAYILVIGFHSITGWLFPIGVFPWVMILATTIFFPVSLHEKFITWLEKVFHSRKYTHPIEQTSFSKSIQFGFALFFFIQILLPMRYLIIPGDLFWSESGYRFSWRVMLMEKAGNVAFYVEEGEKRYMVANYEYLTPQQEKMMATQPDMILQFAEFLEEKYRGKGFNDPRITADSYVTINGRPHRRYIDPEADLTKIENTNDANLLLTSYE